jgi:putative membrane protein
MLDGLLVGFLVNAATFYVLGSLLEGVKVSRVVSALITALVFAILNKVLGGILAVFLLPLNLISIFLTRLLVSALVLYAVAFLVPGFRIRNLYWALIMAFLFSLVNQFLSKIIA